jgi:hypothetical protein
MAGGEPSRFDYLFEPTDGDVESAGNGDAQVTASRRSKSALALLAAVVLGAGLGAGLVWSGPADAIEKPRRVTTTAPPQPTPTSSPVVESPSPEPPPESVIITNEPAPPPPPTVTPSAQPQLPPPTSQTLPPTKAPTPSVRAPLSVSPEPRPAFPNQTPGNGTDDRGLLPGLGGLL